MPGRHEEFDEFKRRYDNLVGKNLAGVFRTTITGAILECNQSLVDLLGFNSIGELMAIQVDDLYVDLVERQKYLEDLQVRKQLINYEVLLKHKSGKVLHVLENVFLREVPGRPTIIEGTVIDITAIRQDEMEQRSLLNNYRQLVDRIRDGVLVIQDGRVKYANPAAEHLFGIGALIGLDWIDLLEPQDREAVGDLLRELHGEDEADPMPVHIRKDGTRTRILVMLATATWHMGRPAVQVALQDMSAQRTLMQERLRVKLAEEANIELRKEIAEHQRTQAHLQQSKRFASSLVDSSMDIIIAVDRQGMIAEFNPAASIKFGYEKEEVLGMSYRLLYADETEFLRLQERMNKDGAFAGELRNITRGGREFISFLNASKLFDDQGNLLGSMGISRDITQTKLDQQALHISEERYRDLVENTTDLIHSVDLQGKFIYVNRAWKELFGHAEEDLHGITLMDLLPEGDRDSAREWLKHAREQDPREVWRGKMITKEGRSLEIEGTSSLREEGGKAIAIRSIFRDVTASHRLQEKLRMLAAKEQALFQTSEHMFWTVDRRTALSSFNMGYAQMIRRLYGVLPEVNTDTDKRKANFASEQYHEFWKAKYEEVFQGHSVRFETDLVDTAGQRVCNEIFISPVWGPEDRVVEAFGIGHEITAARVAQEKAQEQSARLRAIFESSANMMIWTMDHDLIVTSFNQRFEYFLFHQFGMKAEVGFQYRERLRSLVSEVEDGVLFKDYTNALEGTPQQVVLNVSNPHRPEPTWIEVYISPIIVDGSVKELSCVAYDITERKLAEQLVIDNLHEKEVLLKEVHHRVKNNLQIISSIFSLQRDHVDDDPRALELLRDGQNRVRSMAFIHESLYQNKSFSQVDLADYTQGLCRNLMMSYSLTEKVGLVLELQPVLVDLDKAIPCGLVLNELIGNALKHAFPGGGYGAITIRLKEENGQVEIELSDNGVGEAGGPQTARPSGLGMELVDMLIEQLDGRIRKNEGPLLRGTSYLITFGRS